MAKGLRHFCLSKNRLHNAIEQVVMIYPIVHIYIWTICVCVCNKAGKTCFEKMWQSSRLAGSRGVCLWSRWKKWRPSGQFEEVWPHPTLNATGQIAAAVWGNRNGMFHCHCWWPTVSNISSCNFSSGNSGRKLRVFHNWVMRNKFGPKRHELTADSNPRHPGLQPTVLISFIVRYTSVYITYKFIGTAYFTKPSECWKESQVEGGNKNTASALTEIIVC